MATSVLHPPIRAETIADIQAGLRTLDEEKGREAVDLFRSSDIVFLQEGYEILLHEMLCILAIRPHSMPFLMNITKYLIQSSGDLDSLFHALKKRYLSIDMQSFTEDGAATLHFAKSMLKSSVITTEHVSNFAEDVLSHESVEQIEMFYIFFSKFMKSEQIDKFKAYFARFSLGNLKVFGDKPSQEADPDVMDRASTIGYIQEPFGMVFFDDDVEKLRSIVEKEDFEIYGDISPCPLHPWDTLHCTTSISHIAAFFGAKKCYELLLENGGDPEAIDEDKQTVFAAACASGNTEVIAASKKLTDIQEAEYTFLLVIFDHPDLLFSSNKKVIQSRSKTKTTNFWINVLSMAACGNNFRLVKEALKHIKYPNSSFPDGHSPIAMAKANGHIEMERFLQYAKKNRH